MSSKSDFIGIDPIHKLLVRFATPAVISISINSLYNIVDRLYIGRGVGADAQAGLALTFPFMIVLAAFGMLVGLGSGATVSILLGEKKVEEAEKVTGQAFALFLIFVGTIQIFGLYFLDDILELLGGTEQAIPYARDYLSIILWGNLFQHISFGMSNVIRSEGNPRKAMRIMLLGALMNIALDPIFIFYFKMGIKGAAYATILAMMCSSAWVIHHYIWGSSVLRLRLKNIRLFRQHFTRVVNIGLAPCVMQIINCGISVIFNHSFTFYAEDAEQATLAIGVWGVVNTIIMTLLMPAFGIVQGAQPILGYNHGAKNFSRVLKTLKIALRSAAVVSIAMAILMYLFANYFTLCFSNQYGFLTLATKVLRINAISFSFIGPAIVVGHYYQATGKAFNALIISLTRQVLILIPVLLFLPRWYGFNSIWWAPAISDILSGLIHLLVYMYESRKLKAIINPVP